MDEKQEERPKPLQLWIEEQDEINSQLNQLYERVRALQNRYGALERLIEAESP